MKQNRKSAQLRCLLLAMSLGVSAPPAVAFDPREASVGSINAAFDAGELTAEQVVRAYLERIAAYDKQGPAINALISLNPAALERARALDAERLDSGPRSPLHGIPIILKDNYATADLPTTGGSIALRGIPAAEDGHIVKRLREAGAIVLGKANMSELALSYGWLGYSSVVGVTRNPYNLKRNASGSSSGSAAAVAAGFAVLATGTDTAGSIRGPAAVTGVVGIKPTRGLTSRAGIIPASLSFDVGGPIARTVTDAAQMLNFMTGGDREDPTTAASEGRLPADYTGALDDSALRGQRIGVVRTWLGANAEVDAIFEQNLALLKAQGATLVDIELPAQAESLWPLMGPVVDAQFRPQLEAYLETLDGNAPGSLEALLKISESRRVKRSDTPVNPARIQGYRDAIANRGLGDAEVLDLLSRKIPEFKQAVIDLLEESEVTALVMPTLPCPASPRFDVEDATWVCDTDDEYKPCYLASVTGFPEITLPAGYTPDGLPVGLSFLGPDFSEPVLIGYAYDFEQAADARRPAPTTPPLAE